MFRAALASIAAHLLVLVLGLFLSSGLQSTGQRDDRVSRLAATLAVVATAHAQTPPQTLPRPASSATRGFVARPARAAPQAPASTPRDEPGIPEPARLPGPGENAPADYVASGELDKRPFPLTRLDFPYPDLSHLEASGAEQQGTIELTLYIGKAGRVDDVRIDSASVDQALVALAIETLVATPFSPGERNGQAVAARLRIEVSYTMPAP